MICLLVAMVVLWRCDSSEDVKFIQFSFESQYQADHQASFDDKNA